jgi:hypothetical protein
MFTWMREESSKFWMPRSCFTVRDSAVVLAEYPRAINRTSVDLHRAGGI